MSNTPMHDVRMLKVLVEWAPVHSSAYRDKETPVCLASCTVERGVTPRLHLQGGVFKKVQHSPGSGFGIVQSRGFVTWNAEP